MGEGVGHFLVTTDDVAGRCGFYCRLGYFACFVIEETVRVTGPSLGVDYHAVEMLPYTAFFHDLLRQRLHW